MADFNPIGDLLNGLGSMFGGGQSQSPDQSTAIFDDTNQPQLAPTDYNAVVKPVEKPTYIQGQAMAPPSNPAVNPGMAPPSQPQPPSPTPPVDSGAAPAATNPLAGNGQGFNPLEWLGNRIVMNNPTGLAASIINPQLSRTLTMLPYQQKALEMERTQQGILNEQQQYQNARLANIQSQQTIASNAANQQAQAQNSARLQMVGIAPASPLTSSDGMQAQLAEAASKGNSAALMALPPSARDPVMAAYNESHDDAENAVSENVQRLNAASTSPDQYADAVTQAKSELSRYGYDDLSRIIPDDPNQWKAARAQIARMTPDVSSVLTPYRNSLTAQSAFGPANKDQIDRVQTRIAPDPVFGGPTNFDVQTNPGRRGQLAYDVTPVLTATPHGPNQPIVGGDVIKGLAGGVKSDMDKLYDTMNQINTAQTIINSPGAAQNPKAVMPVIEGVVRAATGARGTHWAYQAQHETMPIFQQGVNWLQKNINGNVISPQDMAQIKAIIPAYKQAILSNMQAVTNGAAVGAGKLGAPLESVFADKDLANSKVAEDAWRVGHQQSVAQYTTGSIPYRGRRYMTAESYLGGDFPATPPSQGPLGPGGQPPAAGQPQQPNNQSLGGPAGPASPPGPAGGAGQPPAAPPPSFQPPPGAPQSFQPPPGPGVGFSAGRGANVPAQTHYSNVQQFATNYGANPALARNMAIMLTSAASNESDINPTRVHDMDANGNPTGYGLYGHRLGRLTAMQNFTGAVHPTADQQEQFAAHELLTSNDPFIVRAREILSNPNATAQDLTIAQMLYERPAGFSLQNPAGGNGWARRLSNTQTMMNGRFDGVGTGRSAPGNAPTPSLPTFAQQPGGAQVPFNPPMTPFQRISQEANAAATANPNAPLAGGEYSPPSRNAINPQPAPAAPSALPGAATGGRQMINEGAPPLEGPGNAFGAGMESEIGYGHADAAFRTWIARNGKSFAENLKDVRAEHQAAEAGHPWATAAGQMAGGIAGVSAATAAGGPLAGLAAATAQGGLSTESTDPTQYIPGAIVGGMSALAGGALGAAASAGMKGLLGYMTKNGAGAVQKALDETPIDQIASKITPVMERQLASVANKSPWAQRILDRLSQYRVQQAKTNAAAGEQAAQQTLNAAQQAAKGREVAAGLQTSQAENAAQQGVANLRSQYQTPAADNTGEAIQGAIQSVPQGLQAQAKAAFGKVDNSGAMGAVEPIAGAADRALAKIDADNTLSTSAILGQGSSVAKTLKMMSGLEDEATNGVLPVGKLMSMSRAITAAKMAAAGRGNSDEVRALRIIQDEYHGAMTTSLIQQSSEEGAAAAQSFKEGRALWAQSKQALQPPPTAPGIGNVDAQTAAGYKVLRDIAARPDANGQNVLNSLFNLSDNGFGQAAVHTAKAFLNVTKDNPEAVGMIKWGAINHLTQDTKLPGQVAKNLLNFVNAPKSRPLAETLFSPEEIEGLKSVARDITKNGENAEFFRGVQMAAQKEQAIMNGPKGAAIIRAAERAGDNLVSDAKAQATRYGAIMPEEETLEHNPMHYMLTLQPGEAVERLDFKKAAVDIATGLSLGKAINKFNIWKMNRKIGRILGPEITGSNEFNSWESALTRGAAAGAGAATPAGNAFYNQQEDLMGNQEGNE